MRNTYDFVVIGAGISACTFASSLNNRFSDASILLIENGRRIGGRSTTRQSRKNINLEYDHGLPSVNFSQNISQDICTLISPLIKSKQLIDISKDILLINKFGKMDNEFSNNKVYRSVPFMINFCDGIINQAINPKNIDFLFQTLIKSIVRVNNLWELKVNNGKSIKSKNLILSSSFIAHPRCLKILKINSIPLSDVFIDEKDEIVDAVLKKLRSQEYIKRKNYILYISNSDVVKNFKDRYLQIYFSKSIRDEYNFERIIFQTQNDGSMVIILHCFYISKCFDFKTFEIINSLKRIFFNYQKFIDLFLQAKLLNTMDWRASQPINNFVPKELQWSSISNIGFCGDWIAFNGYGGVESAMNSSIRLANLLNW